MNVCFGHDDEGECRDQHFQKKRPYNRVEKISHEIAVALSHQIVGHQVIIQEVGGENGNGHQQAHEEECLEVVIVFPAKEDYIQCQHKEPKENVKNPTLTRKEIIHPMGCSAHASAYL